MKRILIVDDSPSIRQVVALTLRSKQYEVIEAEDGQIGLNQVKGHEFQLVICDVNMPNMDGITFVNNMKNNPDYENYKYIPIVMLTTESGEEKKNQGQVAGAKAWMVKPFLPDRLLMVVEKLIGLPN